MSNQSTLTLDGWPFAHRNGSKIQRLDVQPARGRPATAPPGPKGAPPTSRPVIGGRRM